MILPLKGISGITQEETAVPPKIEIRDEPFRQTARSVPDFRPLGLS
jgi:hypothetical protein